MRFLKKLLASINFTSKYNSSVRGNLKFKEFEILNQNFKKLEFNKKKHENINVQKTCRRLNRKNVYKNIPNKLPTNSMKLYRAGYIVYIGTILQKTRYQFH